ncbi:rab proteins geranylgeranyltransferase component A 1 [Asbolus verrucosus]|uniref:Rab proteins geranylgeranyltransferase component A 1 n=1 Tax=Asbolus verrucosus TaxID=1661398 RepID=A0A482WA68_ASBVE|nr:rab proteins geranylgeranyltransferase component A 1 [Asbolus verrucosus]
MDCDLPTDFDIIVVGTGVVESIVSAAASRIGKRVLHIDSNNYYGGLWASFNLDAIQQLNVISERTEESFSSELVKENEKVFPVGNNLFNLKNVQIKWHIPEKVEPKEETEENEVNKPAKVTQWTEESLIKDSRKFNIDLTPKLQFARGEFVELLISSNIARYSEYRSVSRVLTWLNGQLEMVPCSRSDVFANNKVTVIEKRMLMKLFLSLDSGDQEYVGYENKTFRAFLKDKKLTPNLIHYVLYAISMSTDETLCLQGIQSTKRFLDSLGRFGKTPFLFSMLSAVFGGIYALNQPLKGLIFDSDNRFQGLLCGKQRINADYLIMGVEKTPQVFIKSSPQSYISRGILITNKSIMSSEKEHLTLMLYPPEDDIVHLISKQITNPFEDLKHCVENLFNKSEDGRPDILWSCYFSIPDSNDLDLKTTAPKNVAICPGPDLDLDYDNSVKKIQNFFQERLIQKKS